MPNFVCDMSALAVAEREIHVETTQAVFGSVQEIRERPDGYAFRLAGDEGTLMRVAGFVAKERLCCRFFGFQVELSPNMGPIWLILTGEDGVKPFIMAEIGAALPKGTDLS